MPIRQLAKSSGCLSHGYLSMAILLINKRHPYIMNSRLNCLILTVDLSGSLTQYQVKCADGSFSDLFALLHIHHVTSHGFKYNMLLWLVYHPLLPLNLISSRRWKFLAWPSGRRFIVTELGISSSTLVGFCPCKIFFQGK